jgi:hypothetical protein
MLASFFTMICVFYIKIQYYRLNILKVQQKGGFIGIIWQMPFTIFVIRVWQAPQNDHIGWAWKVEIEPIIPGNHQQNQKQPDASLEPALNGGNCAFRWRN